LLNIFIANYKSPQFTCMLYKCVQLYPTKWSATYSGVRKILRIDLRQCKGNALDCSYTRIISAGPESEEFAPHLPRPLPVIKWETKRVPLLPLVQPKPLEIQTLPQKIDRFRFPHRDRARANVPH